MYKNQLEIVGTYSDENQPHQSYLDLLKESSIEYTLTNQDSFIEISPRQYQLITPDIEKKVTPDMVVNTGEYQVEDNTFYFVELNINMGKGVLSHTALIYDEPVSGADMNNIMGNYQNLIVHASSESVYRG
jgi:hypothetical protein